MSELDHGEIDIVCPEVLVAATSAAETWKSLRDFCSTAEILGRRCSTFSPPDSGIRSYLFLNSNPQKDRKENHRYFSRNLPVCLFGENRHIVVAEPIESYSVSDQAAVDLIVISPYTMGYYWYTVLNGRLLECNPGLMNQQFINRG